MTLQVTLLRRVLAAMVAVALSCGVSRALEGGQHATALRADRLEAKLVLITTEQGGHEIATAAKAGTGKPGPAAGVVAAGETNFGPWVYGVSARVERAVRPTHPAWIATVELRL